MMNDLIDDESNGEAGTNDPESDADTKSSKTLLLIRHCEDEQWNDKTRICATRWSSWHKEDHRRLAQTMEAFTDPCLTERGCRDAEAGALRRVAEHFCPDIVYCSPLSRALQTALLAFGDKKGVRFVVHPALKELKRDYTYGGRFPGGKPSCVPLTLIALRAAVRRCAPQCYDRCDWSHVQCACNDDGHFFDAKQSNASMKTGLRKLIEDISSQDRYNRIAVVSHGNVIRELSRSEKIMHGKCILSEVREGRVVMPIK